MVELGLPFLFLPHTAKPQLVNCNLPALDFITSLIPNAFSSPVEEPANLLPNEWVDQYGMQLRKRLRELPATYEYATQRLARQLFPVCRRLAIWSGELSGASAAEMETLHLDLYGHTLRGLVIGVASLAWHGHGFDTGAPRTEVVRVLNFLRDKGQMTKSNLTRFGKVAKVERDNLLDHFVTENLVRVDGKNVTATTFGEFITGLYARNEFPAPLNYWEQVAKDAASAA